MARDSLPAALKALGPMIVVAIPGVRRSPLLARLWVAVAALGVIGGGNFHAHYYQQLVPPLGVLAGIGVAAIWEARARVWVAVERGRCGRRAGVHGAALVRLGRRAGARGLPERPPPPERRRGRPLRACAHAARPADLRAVGGRRHLLPGRPRPGRALHVVPEHPGDPRRAGRGPQGAGRPGSAGARGRSRTCRAGSTRPGPPGGSSRIATAASRSSSGVPDLRARAR